MPQSILPENDFSEDVLKEVSFKVGKESYTLREASYDAVLKHRNAIIACTELGPDGQPKSAKNFADTDALLLSMCLFDGENKLVPASKIRSWKASVGKRMLAVLREISELDEDSSNDVAGLQKQLSEIQEKLEKAKAKEEAPKNEPSNSENGSE